MSEVKDNNNLSVTERIMRAGETLGVSRREISMEITRLAGDNDTTGMQSLFKAYENWEIRMKDPGVSKEQIEELAKRNFDVVARFADSYSINRDDLTGETYALESENKPPGKITTFFRKAVGYDPPIDNSINN